MANRIPIDALQKAVYSRLSTALATLTPAVSMYAYMPPQDATYPLAVLSQFVFTPVPDKRGANPQNAVATIEVYSSSPSAAQINQTVNKIVNSLSTALTLESSFADIGLGQQESIDTFATYDQEQDKRILTAVVKYSWTVDDRI